jgi:hypothetical protein
MELTCPRCARSVDETYYGPCESCRQALRGAMQREARAMERTEFEPAMHVTPNAVALKE